MQSHRAVDWYTKNNTEVKLQSFSSYFRYAILHPNIQGKREFLNSVFKTVDNNYFYLFINSYV